MKAKRWTAILLSAVLAFSVCMPVSGISTYAAEEAAAETIQPAPEESDSVQTESAASAAEDLTEESSSEDVPAEDGSVVEEEAEMPRPPREHRCRRTWRILKRIR